MKLKRILLLTLIAVLVISSASCSKLDIKGCELNWERIDNINENTAMDKSTKCGYTR